MCFVLIETTCLSRQLEISTPQLFAIKLFCFSSQFSEFSVSDNLFDLTMEATGVIVIHYFITKANISSLKCSFIYFFDKYTIWIELPNEFGCSNEQIEMYVWYVLLLHSCWKSLRLSVLLTATHLSVTFVLFDDIIRNVWPCS